MSHPVVTVEMDDRLESVKEIFDNAKLRHLPVLDGGQLLGIISDRDLHRSISPNIGTSRFTYRDLETLHKPVHSVMSRNPVTLRETDPVERAITIFAEHRFSCIPIVTDTGTLVGIVTLRDIAKHFYEVAASALPSRRL
jgi:acetoin utilization protein AcuB